MNESEIFLIINLFLNPEQESETQIAFSDVSLNLEKNISRIYLSKRKLFFLSEEKRIY